MIYKIIINVHLNYFTQYAKNKQFKIMQFDNF